ncbi:type III-B CRISPR module RAMP protein Cmr4 [Streptomyces chiangmaiensis]|uniref:Type III-B CRISPR module RAMP protein Cmr4 n=1 Tax=Streptomyces chiangmaiensis TaxID=766497 RepID=A0ABU7FMZ8_9ACTN|nr:type III-B CRISPR module RAMP protein Cmr4 [Streptomyces chiangmaiensis]MED7825500.1 type III-B CRISPR module RAMP protein Cmr4 [Streptomyces chiangmaiensis]
MSGTQYQWLLYLYAESPVHAGAADSSGVIDLPIQREAGTDYPVVWGQSLKGALRQTARDRGWKTPELVTVFGSEPSERGSDGADHGVSTAGLLSVGDAQLVALPVPTLRHTFAWATSAVALGRLARKHTALPDGVREKLSPPARAQRHVALAAHEEWCGRGDEVFGPLVMPLVEKPDAQVQEWAKRLSEDAVGDAEEFAPFAAKMRRDLLVVDDDAMPVLNRDCTQVVARVQLNSGKTVKQLFYSEYLPAETVLAASLSLRAPTGQVNSYADKFVELLHGRQIQLGGDETIGKGLMWCRIVGTPVTAGKGEAE